MFQLTEKWALISIEEVRVAVRRQSTRKNGAWKEDTRTVICEADGKGIKAMGDSKTLRT